LAPIAPSANSVMLVLATIADITWRVMRLNEDGSETTHEICKSEEQAKTNASKMDKKAREGRA
jgi:hypothetical protein